MTYQRAPNALRRDRRGVVRATEKVATPELLRGYSDLVMELGGAPDWLMTRAGLRSSHFESAAHKIPLRAVGELLELTALELQCPDFGLRLAEKQSPSNTMRPLVKLFSHAPDIEHALRSSMHHPGAYNSGLRSFLFSEHSDAHRLVFEIMLEDFFKFPQLMERIVLISHRFTHELSRGAAKVREVHFTHKQIGNDGDYVRRFGAPVKFGQYFTSITFSNADLKVPLENRNHRVFMSEHRRIAKIFPAMGRDIKSLVVEAIIKLTLEKSDCSKEEVSDFLGYSARTFHRKLTEAETDFVSIRDDVRKRLLMSFLADQDLSITEIAGRLGFSEGSTLSHACQRWFSASPKLLRERLYG